MSEYTNALARFLQSEKNAFQEPQRMLWPFRRDPYTGDMGFGHSMVTESLENGLKFPGKVMRGEVPLFAEYEDGKVHYSPQMMQGANDTAGLAMTGAIGLPKPQNAIGSGGGGKMVENALPMDHASRMARAKEMGFDTEKTMFRGAEQWSDSIVPSADGTLGPGVYMTPNPKYASRFGDVQELLTRGKILSLEDAPATVVERPFWREAFSTDGPPTRRAAQWARENGYSGYSTPGHETVIFDPSNIRSINADFDPAKSSSANLLAANPREGAAAAQMTSAAQQDENPLMETLRRYGLLY